MATKAFDLERAKARYLTAKEAYYNDDEPVMSDKAFDKLEDQIREHDPKWKELMKTGARVANKKTEVALEWLMPSLEKKYPEKVDAWITKYMRSASSIVMAKMDGTSLELIYDRGLPSRLITRGDGERGGDVSFLLPALVKAGSIPKRISFKERIGLRCEAIMKELTFQRKWSVKAKGEKAGFKNGRNMVNGLFNRQDAHPALADVDIVVLGVFDWDLDTGLAEMAEAGFTVVEHKRVRRGALNGVKLAAMLARFMEASPYLMDGLVVANYDFIYTYETVDKPKAIAAFKMNDDENAPQVTVGKVVWQRTRLNRHAPKVMFKEPIEIDGVMVTYATCHNAKWMMDRGIGPGAVIKVLRSGGVIPKIVGVVKKAKTLQWPEGAYRWDGVHLVGDDDNETRSEQILFGLKTLGVEHIASGTIVKLLDSFPRLTDYIEAAQYDQPDKIMKRVLGSEKVTAKIHAELVKNLRVIDVKKLMVASGCFDAGVGLRRLTMIQDNGLKLREALTLSPTRLRQTLLEMKGFQEKTAKLIIEGFEAFEVFYKESLTRKVKLVEKTKQKVQGGALNGLTVSFTGFRSKEAEAQIEAAGGEVISFSGKTKVLIYAEDGKPSSKVAKAGDRAMTWPAFVKKYLASK
ncbi:hypothetical protein [Burkholderia phage BCSR5]|nr:hypothetical protein [Burkholderia phage BCSR5]